MAKCLNHMLTLSLVKMVKLMFAVMHRLGVLIPVFHPWVCLIWSMKPAPGQRKGLRLIKRDVTKPFNVELKCFDDHISPSKGSVQQPLSSVTFEKWYMADGVKRVVLNDKRFRGTLFIPPGDGPFPGQ